MCTWICNRRGQNMHWKWYHTTGQRKNQFYSIDWASSSRIHEIHSIRTFFSHFWMQTMSLLLKFCLQFVIMTLFFVLPIKKRNLKHTNEAFQAIQEHRIPLETIVCFGVWAWGERSKKLQKKGWRILCTSKLVNICPVLSVIACYSLWFSPSGVF